MCLKTILKGPPKRLLKGGPNVRKSNFRRFGEVPKNGLAWLANILEGCPKRLAKGPNRQGGVLKGGPKVRKYNFGVQCGKDIPIKTYKAFQKDEGP